MPKTVDLRLPTRYHAIWISGFHIGTRRARTDMLLDFLKYTESDMLYLVGDVIDNWSLKKTWFWDQGHNDVIQKILRKARKGTRVIYIPGNHDERFRDFVGTRFGRVAVMQDAVHITADKKRYLALHGDEFDGVVMVEALASGVPVAAYDVPGPRDIITTDAVGALGNILEASILEALTCKPKSCRVQALNFTWTHTAEQFENYLAPLSSAHKDRLTRLALTTRQRAALPSSALMNTKQFVVACILSIIC